MILVRKMADCRTVDCSLTIAGSEDEVVAAAATHAVVAHGRTNVPAVREEVRRTLAEDRGEGRYGTVVIATLVGDLSSLQRALEQWAAQRQPPGFLVDELMVTHDGWTVVFAVFFENRDAFRRLLEDPEQDRWYTEQIAPHIVDEVWIVGTWQRAVHRAAPSRLPSPRTERAHDRVDR